MPILFWLSLAIANPTPAGAALGPQTRAEGSLRVTPLEIEKIKRTEACRVLCIKDGYKTGDYNASKKCCRCFDEKEYHSFYNRSMSLGLTAPDEGSKFKKDFDYWYDD